MHHHGFSFGNTPTQNITDGLASTSYHTGSYTNTWKPDKHILKSRTPIIVVGVRTHMPHVSRHFPEPALRKEFFL